MSEPTASNEPTLESGSIVASDLSLAERTATRSPASRIAALAACTALVAGLGGFLIGRTSGSSDQSKLKAGANVAESSSSVADTNGANTPGAPIANDSMGDSKIGSSSARPGGGGMYSPNAYEEPKQELITERATTSGITLRAHLQDYGLGTPYFGQFKPWTPEGWCFPTGNLRISIVTSSAVNISSAAWFSEPKDGLAISTFSAGYAEGSPVFGAAVQVGAGITSVTFTTASGLTDTAAVVRGVALLAVNGPIAVSYTHLTLPTNREV